MVIAEREEDRTLIPCRRFGQSDGLEIMIPHPFNVRGGQRHVSQPEHFRIEFLHELSSRASARSSGSPFEPQTYPDSDAFTRSGVMGNSRSRRPVAWAKALARAAEVGGSEPSPAPSEGSLRSINTTSMVGASG